MNVASAVRLSILFVVVALFALLMPPGCSGSSRSTRQTETPARSPAALEIAMELPMPALVVFDPSGPGDLDSLLRRTYMKKYILDPTQNPGLSSDASARLLATLRTAIPGCVSAFAVEAASRRDVEAAHREAQRRVLADAPSGWLLVYGKLRGQTSGSAGMLFRDSNLGWPHPGFTPIGALVHDWEELRGLLDGEASPRLDRVMILSGPSEFAGSYAVTGFEESEVPEWARPHLQAAGGQAASAPFFRIDDHGGSAPDSPPGGPALIAWSDGVIAVSESFPQASRTYRLSRTDAAAFESRINALTHELPARVSVAPDEWTAKMTRRPARGDDQINTTWTVPMCFMDMRCDDRLGPKARETWEALVQDIRGAAKDTVSDRDAARRAEDAWAR